MPIGTAGFTRVEVTSVMPGASLTAKVTALDATTGVTIASMPVTIDISTNTALAAIITPLMQACAQAAGFTPITS
jgi:hypothetical protein